MRDLKFSIPRVGSSNLSERANGPIARLQRVSDNSMSDSIPDRACVSAAVEPNASDVMENVAGEDSRSSAEMSVTPLTSNTRVGGS